MSMPPKPLLLGAATGGPPISCHLTLNNLVLPSLRKVQLSVTRPHLRTRHTCGVCCKFMKNEAKWRRELPVRSGNGLALHPELLRIIGDVGRELASREAVEVSALPLPFDQQAVSMCQRPQVGDL